MQDLKEAINNILDEELVKAKEIIHANLYAKMGALLEQTLLEYAPTVLEDDYMEEETDDVTEAKKCEDGDCEDEDSGYSKKKMKSDKEDKEDEEDDEEEEDDEKMNEAFETFTAYLSELVEEIEAETGEELTEEEIVALADIVMNENFDDEGVEEVEE